MVLSVLGVLTFQRDPAETRQISFTDAPPGTWTPWITQQSSTDTYPRSLFTVGTREAREAQRALREDKHITLTRFHTKEEKTTTEMFSQWMRVSLPDLWPLSSRISRKSRHTEFALKPDEDVKRPQTQKKEPALCFLARTGRSSVGLHLLSHCSQRSSLTRGANTTFGPLWTVLSSGPWYSNFTLFQIK